MLNSAYTYFKLLRLIGNQTEHIHRKDSGNNILPSIMHVANKVTLGLMTVSPKPVPTPHHQLPGYAHHCAHQLPQILSGEACVH